MNASLPPEILLEAVALYCCGYRRKDICGILKGWYGENVADAFWNTQGVNDLFAQNHTVWGKTLSLFENWVDDTALRFPFVVNGVNTSGFMNDASSVCLSAYAATDELEAESVAARLIGDFEELNAEDSNNVVEHYCLLKDEWAKVRDGFAETVRLLSPALFTKII